MKNELTETITGGLEPQELRRELQEKQTKSLRRRRAIIFHIQPKGGGNLPKLSDAGAQALLDAVYH